MTLYKKFRGQEPTVDALLKRAGLLWFLKLFILKYLRYYQEFK
jgi:hypothetical protein